MSTPPDAGAAPAVITPRLRLRATVLRGLAHGAALLAVTTAAALLTDGHEPRLDLLALVSGVTLVLGAVGLLVGLFFWFCAPPVLRWRDWRAAPPGREGALALLAPTFVRAGAACVAPLVGSVLLYHLVDAAAVGSRLYG